MGWFNEVADLPSRSLSAGSVQKSAPRVVCDGALTYSSKEEVDDALQYSRKNGALQYIVLEE